MKRKPLDHLIRGAILWTRLAEARMEADGHAGARFFLRCLKESQ